MVENTLLSLSARDRERKHPIKPPKNRAIQSMNKVRHHDQRPPEGIHLLQELIDRRDFPWMRGELSGGKEAIRLVQEKYPASGAAEGGSDVFLGLAHISP